MPRPLIDTLHKMEKTMIQLGSRTQTQLLAERVGSSYRELDYTTNFYFVDHAVGVKTHLATLRDGRWSFPHPKNATEFFTLAKSYPKFFKTAIKNTQTKDNTANWTVQWVCFKRKFKFELLKIKRML
jgi:hypothetical protein